MFKSETQPTKSPPETTRIQMMIQAIAVKSLKKCKDMVNQDIYYELIECVKEPTTGLQFFISLYQRIVDILLQRISQLLNDFQVDISPQDYRKLEQTTQKLQGEVRKHVKMQQQLKLYLDSIYQKQDELMIKLHQQQQRYHCLFQIQLERRTLQDRLLKYESETIKNSSPSQSRFETINKLYMKECFGMHKYHPTKTKKIADKLNDRIKKISQKRIENRLHGKDQIEHHINREAVKRKKSLDFSNDKHRINQSLKEQYRSIPLKTRLKERKERRLTRTQVSQSHNDLEINRIESSLSNNKK